MVKPELLEWINSQEAQGCSEKALTEALTKQGYAQKEIKEAFAVINHTNQKVPFSVAFTLLMGLNVISLLAVVIVSGRTFLSKGESNFGVYSSLVLIGVALGYLGYHIKEKLGSSEKFGAILGILFPLLTLILIIVFLMVHQTVLSQLAELNAKQINGAMGFSGELISFFDENVPSPLLAAVLFYLSANVFMIISIIRKKEFRALLWYLLAPIIFFVVWWIIGAFVSMILSMYM